MIRIVELIFWTFDYGMISFYTSNYEIAAINIGHNRKKWFVYFYVNML
jgi:hypothetical protein